MFGKYKKEVIPFNAFMDGSWKEKKKEIASAEDAKNLLTAAGGCWVMKHMSETAFAASPMGGAVPVMGTVGGTISAGIMDKVMSGFQPLIDLVQAMGYPVAFVFLASGMILIMMGQKTRGISMIKWTAVGYIGLQFVPSIMEILYEIGKAIGQ